MSAFLPKIREITQERVAVARSASPVTALKTERRPHNVVPAFKKVGYHVIAEVKFASPSEGIIRAQNDAVAVARGYLDAGAHMLSVLTEPLFFKGKPEYLRDIRAAFPDALLLRKDFTVDSYQLHEALAWGADAVLLIAAMTEDALTLDLYTEARELGLTVLVEVHDEKELEFAASLNADFIGVNNRNLKTLKTDLETGRRLAKMKPRGAAFICESGLATSGDVRCMREEGYDGFLMGTHFMRKPDPGAALKKLLEELA